MRLYSGKVHPLADEAVRALVQGKDIEVESSHEVVRDLESVLNGYVTAERECTEKSRRLLEQRSMPATELGRIKRLTAEHPGLLALIHFNDSAAPCGSCADRHAYIGQGHLGIEGMTALAEAGTAAATPMVIEY